MIAYIVILACCGLVGLLLYRVYWRWITEYATEGKNKCYVHLIVFAAIISTLISFLHTAGWAIGAIAYLLSLV